MWRLPRRSCRGAPPEPRASPPEPGPPLPETALVSDPRYLDHVLIRPNGSRPPEVPERLVRIRAALEARGLIEATVPLSPTADPLDRIRAHHTGGHVDAVRQLGVTARVAELAVSGALTAVDAVAAGTVRNAFCAARPPGHHANNTGAEEGFCYYSNAAIAARYAQEIHGYEKVVIIDWDYHHGNATQNAFYGDPSVLFFSSHDWNAYPGTGDPSLTGEGDGAGLNINVHLDCGATRRGHAPPLGQRVVAGGGRLRPPTSCWCPRASTAAATTCWAASHSPTTRSAA